MPPINKNPKPYFENMLMLCKSKNIKNISMGMSKDYEQAIISGATNIRIGNFIFGERDNKKWDLSIILDLIIVFIIHFYL